LRPFNSQHRTYFSPTSSTKSGIDFIRKPLAKNALKNRYGGVSGDVEFDEKKRMIKSLTVVNSQVEA
jgi:hypothetical protein